MLRDDCERLRAAFKSQYAQSSEFIAHAHGAQFTVKIEKIIEKARASHMAALRAL